MGAAPLDPVRRVAFAQHRGEARGLMCLCSAQPQVLAAALEHARQADTPLCIESTSNQVNPWGGYTGMTPAAFRTRVRTLARRLGTPPGLLVLGGDHLGPHPWRHEPAAQAMDKARRLVRACVRANYTKLHLDASMPCAGDARDAGGALPVEVIARRTAELCRAAEQAAAAAGSLPVYIVGTEVPRPGGARAHGGAVEPTRPEDARQTLDALRAAFRARTLERAWDRVTALVVQPGVEFGDERVQIYNPRRARPLARFIEQVPGVVYEAHSTDYQPLKALRTLVRDHFALLKVGPWLTFAFREAVFGLAAIEREMLGSMGREIPSRLRETVEKAMLADPSDWKPYTRGAPAEQTLSRRFGLSDRIRYYWARPSVAAALERLMDNLSARPIPSTLMSQYLPLQFEAVAAGLLEPNPRALIRHHVTRVIERYARAVQGEK